MKRSIALAAGLALLAAVCASASIIKIGDVLEVSVLNHPEFTGRYTVNENGTIDYPLLADEQVVNISTSELMNQLQFRLVKHIDNPLVLISIVERPEIYVLVLGQVTKPGPIKTYLGATLQEALALAQGPTPMADLTRVKIVPKNGADAMAKYFNLKEFMLQGNMDDMPRLQADDMVVLLTQERTKKIKVIGGVQKPGFYDLQDKLNIFEAIYLAGGPAEKADLSRVRRISQSDDKSFEEVVNVQGYIDKGKMGEIPMMAEGDVIIVYTRWFDWKTLLAILNNTLLFIVTIQAFSGVFK